MEVKLNILERIRVSDFLPAKGDSLMMRLVVDLERKLGFDAKEQDELGMISDVKGGVSWDPNADKDFIFNLENKEIELIRSGLMKADKENRLTRETISLYEKFTK